MIKPTVGRVVWYRAHPEDHRKSIDAQPCAAIIAYVHSDELVNLMVIGHDGVAFSKADVTLVQEEGETVEAGWCQWMPYQKGQAAKTEALEKKLSADPADLV